MLHAGKAVQNGVFRQRLQKHFRNHARKQRLRHGLRIRKALRQTDALDLDVAVQNFQLPPQGDEFVRRDAEAQDIGQVRRHQRHLRHLIDLADPFHGVKRVAQKVRVQLRLQHLDLRAVERALVFQQRLLVVPEGDDHGVELLRKLGQLVVLAIGDRDLHVQIVFPDLPDGMVQPSDGLEDLTAQL